MEKKLFLLDAMALIYRAYYALIRSPIITSKGKNTNAQFGFTNTLFDLLSKEKPTHLAVAFDTWAPTERHTDFEAYKANRQEAPEDLLASIPDIKKIIEGFNLPVVECDGYEADDIIGALAQQAEKEGYEVFMVTPDKDFGQLVTDKIKIYKPGYQGGKVEIMGVKEVCEKWGIKTVSQVIDILGLMGDAADNIPGIAGIGEKTAAKLLAQYETVENVLADAENIKGALGEKIRAGKDAAIMSKKLATIITEVPCKFHEEDFRVKAYNTEILKDLFAEFEFKTLGKRILGDEYNVFVVEKQVIQTDLFGNAMEVPIPKPEEEKIIKEERPGLSAEKNINNTPHNYYLVEGDDAINDLIKKLKGQKEISFDTETTHVDANEAELVGLSFSYKNGEGYYVPCPDDEETVIHILNHFKELFTDESKIWIGQNIKYDLLVLKWYGFEIKGQVFDTMLAHYVIESEGRRNMDLLSAQYLGYLPVSITELIGKKGKEQGNMRDVEVEKVKEYAAEDADITLQLKNVFTPYLKDKQVEKVFYEVETPLVKVLADMEYEGVKVDMNFLNVYSKELETEAAKCEQSVFTQAGIKFNLASPKQLGEVLFEKLQLDKGKKTKSGQHATGEDVLLKLAKENPIVEDILNFRELTKLKSTYVDALPQLVNKKTGRVHTSYGQAIAVTGRLSSNNPNLQNIPIRTERGREIRKAFIPRDSDHLIISADYSQIELRIVAAISADPAMCEAFKEKKDIHTATAAKVFNVAEEDVTKEMRYKAKSVNFGIIYGQGAFGLAENLGISRTEAKEIIDNYKKQFANIQKYMDETIQFCKTNGYVETLMGRKRWLKDINSNNWTVRGYAERNAINSPIQGTAADMIKLAMIKIHNEFKKNNFKSKMIMQVHDELVFDAHKSEVEEIKPIIIECMQNALLLPNGVPADAEIGVGENWLEAH
jgi:DNA polymerase-1